jgi:hypothetical protein
MTFRLKAEATAVGSHGFLPSVASASRVSSLCGFRLTGFFCGFRLTGFFCGFRLQAEGPA